ncbi:MAG: PQQ-dependent sugar dehydrogenase [Chitinophagaceae bacterium]
MKLPLLSLLFITMACCNKKDSSATAAAGIQNKVLTENLNYPWEILWGPDNKIWVTERNGRISRVDTASGAVSPLFTIAEVKAQGEGGLLGMVLHPNFTANPYVYVAYDYEQAGSYKEKIVRYSFNGTSLTSPFTIIDNISASSIHNGCRLLISADLKLFISTGDASNQSLPQNSTSVNGKILRLNLDGSIPADNPVAGSPIWSKGHRNPQGLVFVNNALFSSEHGPDSDDEINIIEKGRNFGWPDVKGFCNESAEASFCSASNVKEPIKAWTPTLAVSGMGYYTADAIPQFKNSLLVATLKGSRLMQLKLNDAHTTITATTELLSDEYGRLRDVCISPDGKVYVCSSNGGNDKIIVLSKK